MTRVAGAWRARRVMNMGEPCWRLIRLPEDVAHRLAAAGCARGLSAGRRERNEYEGKQLELRGEFAGQTSTGCF